MIFYWRKPAGSGPTPPPPVFTGYVVPSTSTPLPGGLTLEQFIQTIIVGISGYTASLVRPSFQVGPPKQPDITVNWIAFNVNEMPIDDNAAVFLNSDGNVELNRQQKIDVEVSFYGPNAREGISVFRDGFQITQNLEGLLLANMGFNGISQAIRGPDLVNERWVERYLTTFTLVRYVVRTYPIVSFTSSSGVVHTVLGSTDYDLDWQSSGGS